MNHEQQPTDKHEQSGERLWPDPPIRELGQAAMENPWAREKDRTITPMVWVGSLADYNAGTLHGDWLDATVGADKLHESVQAMLARSPEAAETGLPSEEWGIFDYEGFGPYRIGEYADLGQVAAIAEGIQTWGLAFAGWASEYPDQLDDFEQAYLGNFDSLTDYARHLVEDLGYEQELDTAIASTGLGPYLQFDYDLYGRDLVAGVVEWTFRPHSRCNPAANIVE
jgi:antirestriction protein